MRSHTLVSKLQFKISLGLFLSLTLSSGLLNAAEGAGEQVTNSAIQSLPEFPMGPGVLIKMKLLYNGKPLPNTKVSFIPRGSVLTADFDKKFERLTDENGIVS
jgi:hypothetical protein